MSTIVKLGGSPAVAAACPEPSHVTHAFAAVAEGPSAIAASSLSAGGRLRGTGVSAVAMAGLGLSASAVREVNERPTKAPAAVAAQADAYAAAADGAGIRIEWTDDATSSFEGRNVVLTKTQQSKRAFRGLEPWRDPA